MAAWIGSWMLLSLAAGAVVIDSGDGSGNTGAPADDPGFVNVGWSSNSLTGVYVGNRWVLTASHVGEPAAFTFDQVTYPTVLDSRIRLETSPGVGADLALVRLASEPPLPTPVLATTGPAVDDVVVMIGNGRLRETDLTCWDSLFSEVGCSRGPPPDFEGFKTLSPRLIRWGRNEVTFINSQVTIVGSGTTRCFWTEFEQSGGVTDEAQLVRGDSGGGAFLKRGGAWELVGILFANKPEPGQPADTAVFGNDSLMADIAFYEPQIDAIVNPPFLIPLAPLAAVVLGGSAMALWVRRSLRRRCAGA
jgi:hypothetical protein